MRVLHVTPIYGPAWNAGGIVRSTSELCRSLVQLDHEVTVFATNSDGTGYLDVPANRAVDVGGVRVYYCHTPTPKVFRYSPSLRQMCRSELRGFDIVHITSFWNYPGIVAAQEAIRRGIPYVVSTRGGFTPAALSNGRFRKWLYLKLIDERIHRGAAAYHYTSLLERKKTQEFRVQRPGFIIPNGIDLSWRANRPSRIEARQRLGLLPGDFAIGFLGRLHKIKALDVLLAAADRVVKTGYAHVKLLLAGPDGGVEARLRRFVNHNGLSKHVRWLGPVHGSAKLDMLAALDLFALVSWTENFGNAAAEAMAAGVPVLVSEHVGICDDVRESGSGWIVPVEVETVAEKLMQIVENRRASAELGRNAEAFAVRQFESRRVAELMATAYQDVISGRRSAECMWDS